MSTGGSPKVEYAPLLKLGRHLHTLEELETLCVDPFPTSTTRKAIMTGFRAVVDKLDAAGIVGELWVDGSFVTAKPDPDDTDVVLRMQSSFSDNCTPEQEAAIAWFEGDLYTTFKCHSFVIVEFPEGDPNYWVGEYAYCYWMKQWGFARNEDTKGIALIQLPRSTT